MKTCEHCFRHVTRGQEALCWRCKQQPTWARRILAARRRPEPHFRWWLANWDLPAGMALRYTKEHTWVFVCDWDWTLLTRDEAAALMTLAVPR